MFKAVVFDMDGILFDSERIISEIWKQIAVLDRIDEQKMQKAINNCIGFNHNDISIYFNSHFGEHFNYVEFRRRAAEMFHDKVDKEGLPVKDGAIEILNYLQTSKYEIALASSSSTESIYKNLDRADMRKYFKVIVGGDMVEHSKPQPDIYLKACSNLGINPVVCFAVEDSPNGIRSATAAGMKAIMVPDLIQPNEEIMQMLYNKFDSLLDVMNHLKRLESVI